jgi:thiosulfate/3-mercaptopyruvate sulfurtransferase
MQILYLKGEYYMKQLSPALMSIMLICLLVGCASYGTSPKGLEVPIEQAALNFAADVKSGGYKIVSTEELKQWLDQGRNMTIISTILVSDDRAFGMIPNAVNSVIPRYEKELTQAHKDNLLKVAEPDKGKTIVLYCGFVGCRRSHIGAKILVDNGFTNVYRYPGGISAWKEMGYPVIK